MKHIGTVWQKNRWSVYFRDGQKFFLKTSSGKKGVVPKSRVPKRLR
jgi:hypothetical protein